jgi:CheY-like chemotaxis protein/HAMP domain-containing protein
MEAIMIQPFALVLLVTAALLAGAFGGFYFQRWQARRRLSRLERAREALRARRPARPRAAERKLSPPEPEPEPASLSTEDTFAGRRQPAMPEPVETAGSRPTTSRSVRAPGSGPTVLVVDDRYELRAVNTAYLSGHGYRVIEAADGDAALEVARRERPDAILLDHSLPNRTGLEVVRELKSDSATAAIPIVFITAHSYGAVGRSAMAAGCVAFLPKPCDPSRILREIARHAGTPAARR